MQGSKKVLEHELGHSVPFISYPNGKADEATFGRVKAAGYTLGFMEEWGPVQQSPGILALNRYIHLQLSRAWAENYGPVETMREVGFRLPEGWACCRPVPHCRSPRLPSGHGRRWPPVCP